MSIVNTLSLESNRQIKINFVIFYNDLCIPLNSNVIISCYLFLSNCFFPHENKLRGCREIDSSKQGQI